MKTDLLSRYRDTESGREAEAILRSCVHCGFCNATCPTYQLLGDELDGPRGRIYQIKQLLEGQDVGNLTRIHLDRCLTCRSCETTCPSGVQYGRLVDIGRELIEQEVPRPWEESWLRRVLLWVLPYPRRFAALLRLGRLVRPLLPAALKAKVPANRTQRSWPQAEHSRFMLVLEGCVQQAVTPDSNAAAAQVFDRLGIQLRPAPGCCGAASYHLAATTDGLDFARRNIDAWWPAVEAGCEAIISTASGCGVMVKDYGHLLAADPDYADKAQRISRLTRDACEVLAEQDLSALQVSGAGRRIAFHPPCTLQHGQKITGAVESLLTRLGFELVPVSDTHLCCGSAGTYSVLQPEIATQLRDDKLRALQKHQPEMIVTANVGCELHLETAAGVPVRHWISLLSV